MPRLGDLKGTKIEVVSKPRVEYKSEGYRRDGFPPARAVMLNDEVLVQGEPIDEKRLCDLIAAKQRA